jgi:hypothetical protein
MLNAPEEPKFPDQYSGRNNFRPCVPEESNFGTTTAEALIPGTMPLKNQTSKPVLRKK